MYTLLLIKKTATKNLVTVFEKNTSEPGSNDYFLLHSAIDFSFMRM